MNDDLRTALGALVHGDPAEALPADLGEACAGGPFAPAEGLTYEQQCLLTYRRMRWLGDRLPPASTLLARPAQLFTVLEWCAVTSPPVFLGMTLHTCLSLGAIQEFGSGRDDLGDHIGRLDSMDSFGSLLVTEAGRGNSHIGIRTEARYDPATGGFVLTTPTRDDAKFMPNVGLAGVPKLGVVYARLRAGGADHGVFPFVLPIRDADGPRPGIEITPLPEAPYLPLDYATITFDGVRVPARGLLHDSARLSADGTFRDPLGHGDERLARSLDVRHRAWVASAAALGAAIRASAALAIRFSAGRNTLSRAAPEGPVLRYRSQQRPLYGCLATAYAMTSLINQVKRTLVASAQVPDPAWTRGPGFNRTIGLVKAMAGWEAERVAAECGQRCGAHGMFGSSGFAAYQGLGHMLGPAAGDSYLIVLEAARAMAAGTAYRPPSPGMVQLNRRAVGEPQVVRELVAARERSLHAMLSGELDTAARRAQGPFQAWDNRSWLARELVEAHGTRLAVECLLADARTLAEPGRTALELLCAFFGLREAWRHSGWYLSTEALTVRQVRAIPARLNGICERLTAHAEPLAGALLPAGLDPWPGPAGVLGPAVAGHR
ncbi:acyl-CoA dehydrogenase family protein [Amycolatopsis aidingensis]|uniref:acyl-CoA dehydrogenase family protein n=1 Tax=Amycolatopsis aidingensis TaxID=2842453 RepID=UPI001C0CDC25|nr:acyl-CoA dehydrogenase [Amycolatopsis aidingensis]